MNGATRMRTHVEIDLPALRLLVFLIFLANANTGLAGEFPRGQWQVVEADFPDIGHCLMTEVLEYNLTLPRTDGTDGVYTESFKRDGDAFTCHRVGNFRTSYSVITGSKLEFRRCLYRYRNISQLRTNR